MTDSIFEVKQISKRFPRFTLDVADIVFRPSRIVGLLGHNGAGKSTLMKCLAGALRCEERVVVNQSGLRQTERMLRDKTSLLLENPPLYEWMRPRQFIKFLSSFYLSAESADGQGIFKTFLDTEERRIRDLSRGNKVKVAIAAALARNPQMLILDEPTSGLDLMARQSLFDCVLQLRSNSTSILISSHNVEELEMLADEIVILNDGRVVAQGDVQMLSEGWRTFVFSSAKESELRCFGHKTVALGHGQVGWVAPLSAGSPIVVAETVRRSSLREMFLALVNNG